MRGERPAGSDLPRSGQQGALYLDARRTRRADSDDPLGEQPRQARAPGSRGRRLGDRPRGEPGSPAHGLTGRANCAADLYKFNGPPRLTRRNRTKITSEPSIASGLGLRKNRALSERISAETQIALRDGLPVSPPSSAGKSATAY